MNKKLKIFILLIVILTVLCIIFFVYKNNHTKKKTQEAKVVDSIKGYGYKLHDNDSKLYKEIFEELKKNLENEKIDEEKYAESISKLFIIDFFTLENKRTNDDIGGIDFVHKDALENFKLKAKDTMYKYIESNVYGDRKQELPEVNKINEVKLETTKVSYKNIKDSKAYKVHITFDYKKDLGYVKEKNIVLVHEDKILSIIEMK